MPNILFAGPPIAGLPAEQMLDDMYRLRHAVFVDRLQWVPAADDGRERDGFDQLPPVYMLNVGDRREVLGCWRLLPTTGPNMLADLFPSLLDDQPMPRSPVVWEISRFAVRTDRGPLMAAGIVSQLLVGLLEFAQSVGIERIVAATDTRFEKALARAGLPTTRFAPPRTLGNCQAVAGWADMTADALGVVRGEYQRLPMLDQARRSIPSTPAGLEAHNDQ